MSIEMKSILIRINLAQTSFDPSMRLKIYIIFLMISLVVFAYSCSTNRSKQMAEQAVKEFHLRFVKEQYHEIYSQSDDEFRKAQSETGFIAIMKAINEKLGRVKETKEISYHMNLTYSENIVRLTYVTDFSKGKATEYFVWRVKENGISLIRYNIDSPDLSAH
jgi:hypothetical protein